MSHLHVALPFGTALLLAISNVLIHNPGWWPLPIVGLVMLFKNWGKICRDQDRPELFLKLPIVGGIVRKSASAVSFRCLAMLIEANVRLSTALQITADCVLALALQHVLQQDGRSTSASAAPCTRASSWSPTGSGPTAATSAA